MLGLGKSKTRFDRLLKLGGTDLGNKRNRELAKQTQWGRLHILVGPKILQQVTESLQAHLGETEIPGETELIRVSGSGYVKITRWRRIERIGGSEFDF